MKTWPIVVLKFAGIFGWIAAFLWAGGGTGSVELSELSVRFGIIAIITLVVAAWDVGRRGFHGWVRVAAGLSVFVVLGVVMYAMAGIADLFGVSQDHMRYMGWIATGLMVILVPLAGYWSRAAGERLWWSHLAKRSGRLRAAGGPRSAPHESRALESSQRSAE